MYSIDGISLHDAARGWYVRPKSERFARVTVERSSLSVPLRHGVVGGLPTTFGATSFGIVVNVPRADVESLKALLSRPGAKLSPSDAPGREAAFELMSLDHEEKGARGPYVDVTAIVRLPGAFWRDKIETTAPAVALGSASVTTTAFAGLSAPIADAQVRVIGTTGLRVTDSSGAWFEYQPQIPSGKALIFVADKGIARIQTAALGWDDWETDVSGSIDFGGPRGSFELTPSFTDPATRIASLTVTSTARSGASIQLRGKGAYLA